ncbi:hypothetical protein QE441_003663 [Chryseobacterium sp. SORGH_AS909]|nr:hypothetical protein [Chryseobacterium sp. SORGH_AS_0909]
MNNVLFEAVSRFHYLVFYAVADGPQVKRAQTGRSIGARNKQLKKLNHLIEHNVLTVELNIMSNT